MSKQRLLKRKLRLFQLNWFFLTLILLMSLSLFPARSLALPTLFLVQENSATHDDILLKFEDNTLTTVGNIGYYDVRGLTYDATTDTLFAVSRMSSRLITIDPSTGSGTPVSANEYLPYGSNTAEISVDLAGNIYGLGHLSDQTKVDTLLNVNKTTGVATTIGDLGVDVLSGLAFDHSSSILYGTSFNGVLYTINQTNGNASLLGQITGSNGGVARIAFDQETSILYGITYNEQLVTIDFDTLIATEIAQFSIPSQIYSLDFISQYEPIPEPTTMLLLGPGIIGLAGIRRKFKK